MESTFSSLSFNFPFSFEPFCYFSVRLGCWRFSYEHCDYQQPVEMAKVRPSNQAR